MSASAGSRAGRRTKPSLGKRIRILWVFIAIALAIAAAGGYALANWPVFYPKTIAVQGNKRVSADAILASAAIAKDRNIWLLDKRGAQRRIEMIPWVSTATIHRTLPAAVSIAVVERTPAGCLEAGPTHDLVDESGRVLETACAPGTTPVFVIPIPAGIGAATLTRAGTTLDDPTLFRRQVVDVKILRTAGLAPGRVSFDRFGGLEVALTGGPLVRFGDDADLAAKAPLVDPILRTYGARAKDLAVVDLRVPATPIVQDRGKPHR